mmetsp:Transcript_25005/g.67082  ORF Transcript_25005/g.67082 Transcript_25005/m.67082 type:complete len:121 (-) Transcript_25005:549-911(-)
MHNAASSLHHSVAVVRVASHALVEVGQIVCTQPEVATCSRRNPCPRQLDVPHGQRPRRPLLRRARPGEAPLGINSACAALYATSRSTGTYWSVVAVMFGLHCEKYCDSYTHFCDGGQQSS